MYIKKENYTLSDLLFAINCQSAHGRPFMKISSNLLYLLELDKYITNNFKDESNKIIGSLAGCPVFIDDNLVNVIEVCYVKREES